MYTRSDLHEMMSKFKVGQSVRVINSLRAYADRDFCTFEREHGVPSYPAFDPNNEMLRLAGALVTVKCLDSSDFSVRIETKGGDIWHFPVETLRPDESSPEAILQEIENLLEKYRNALKTESAPETISVRGLERYARVIVRDTDTDAWQARLFYYIDDDDTEYQFKDTTNVYWNHMAPFSKDLIGTTAKAPVEYRVD